jgi:hypothetical protein
MRALVTAPRPRGSLAAALPRTPPPDMPGTVDDDTGRRWLAATGVSDVVSAGSRGTLAPLRDALGSESSPSADALGEAWVAATTQGCV